MVTTGSSYEISKVYAENNYCYDQVGDGRHCFEEQSNCHKTQKHDEIAESPCYKDGLGLWSLKTI